MDSIDMTKDITSLTDFQRNTAERIQKIKASKRPEVLTIKGTPELVLLDVATFQELQRKADYAETVEAIRRGAKEIADGKGLDFRQALKEIADRHGFEID